jgi:DNA-binding NarL/FixJ family response regulator
VIQEFIEHLVEDFMKRLERKTGWGKNEVREEFLQSLAAAAIATASDTFQAVSATQSRLGNHADLTPHQAEIARLTAKGWTFKETYGPKD